MYQTLYTKLLERTDATLFLDKTPRYYLILSELKEVFPTAKYILLVRHPLSVLTSVLRTWVKNNWLRLTNYKKDLIDAPKRIIGAQERFGTSTLLVRYEDLVQRPEDKLSDLCGHLEIDFEPDMIHYRTDTGENWVFGDPESVYEHSRPKTSSLEKWVQPENAQEWRLLWEYAHLLGSDIFEMFGYSFETCTAKLQRIQPSSRDLRYTASLEQLMETRSDVTKKWLRYKISMMETMREEGATEVAIYAFEKLKNRVCNIT